MQNWQLIWNKRSLKAHARHDLQTLIELDGYDSGAGRMEAADLRNYARKIGSLTKLADGKSVYEIGCGAGAFLYALREQFEIGVGGCDYARGLIEVARNVFDVDSFMVAHAAGFPVFPKFDVVVSKGVFHYFPDYGYARRALERMIGKAASTIAILEIPNVLSRDAAERARRDQLSQKVYEEKYRGLAHLYFDPDWFGDFALSQDCRWEFHPHNCSNYIQSEFRFDIVIHKS